MQFQLSRRTALLLLWDIAATFLSFLIASLLTKLYNEIDVRPLCEARMAGYTEDAMRDIDRLHVPAEKKGELTEIARKLLNRKN